ncbi:hypothetical protein FACS189490_12030 [Clostridia bacterium]|nr:hypothetical protein FACS189490_12030 [Clostridia bacterium]
MRKILPVILSALFLILAVSCQSVKIEGFDGAKAKEVGSGKTSLHFVVQNDGENNAYFLVKTDKKTVADALTEANLIAGETSEYGFYVTSVNGVALDYNTDNAYWAFYIAGEYASVGADKAEIKEDTVYSFVRMNE